MDDDIDHLLICKLVLEKAGYKILGIPGCKEDEELRVAVREFTPELIFMDHNMPGRCGMDLTRKLKAEDEFMHIPVIYFTSEADIALLAAEAGADGHLRKPFDSEGLLCIARQYAAT